MQDLNANRKTNKFKKHEIFRYDFRFNDFNFLMKCNGFFLIRTIL